MTGPIPDRVAERAASRYIERLVRPDLGPCYISTYAVIKTSGYAQIGWQVGGGKINTTTAHRAAWTYHHGPIPSAMTVDHLCRARRCVRKEHLRLLSNTDNSRDNGQVRTNPETDRLCTQGHRLTMGGAGRRYCRTCQNKNRRARRAAGKRN